MSDQDGLGGFQLLTELRTAAQQKADQVVQQITSELASMFRDLELSG
ncbi:MAG TPA: hypothetical protein VIK57_10620 [Streptosporangiaceae bacterium]